MAKTSTESIINTVGNWYAKLPSLPKNAQEVIVKITPWIALIFGILGVLGGVAGLGILTVLSPFALIGGGAGSLGGGFVASLLLLVSSALLLAAFPGTRSRKTSGWNFLFWSEAVSLVSAVVSVSLSGILFSLIGFYILYQIRSHYR